ncbi:MAG: MarR family transcriptional regulator [Candidatus Moranbacteria bacterium]|jgi:sugar-specific transcriptional regulator TrmB|nr:MarR family transcriptional regulator [Candidatus Moranbacteria bacterium]
MSLEKDLQSIGLEEKEAKIYLAALELGSTNIQDLAEKADIKRSTVYEILKKLEPMGLITESIKGKRKTYIASGPEKLKKNIKEKEQLLNHILPELKSLNNTGNIKPKITYYEGRDGLRQIYNLALETTTKKVDWVSPIRAVMDTVGEKFLEEYIEKRAKEKYWIRSIQITEQQVDTYKYLDPTTFDKTYRRVKFSPPGLDIPNTMAIWDNKVAVISTRKEGFGFIIESADYTRSMKVFYDLLWNASKTYGELFDSKDSNSENKEISKDDAYWE